MQKTDIAVKVPVNELKCLEDQSFFGKSRDEWLTKAVHDGIIRELDQMHDVKRIRALEKKYDLVPQEVRDFFGKD